LSKLEVLPEYWIWGTKRFKKVFPNVPHDNHM